MKEKDNSFNALLAATITLIFFILLGLMANLLYCGELQCT